MIYFALAEAKWDPKELLRIRYPKESKQPELKNLTDPSEYDYFGLPKNKPLKM